MKERHMCRSGLMWAEEERMDTKHYRKYKLVFRHLKNNRYTHRPRKARTPKSGDETTVFRTLKLFTFRRFSQT